MGLGHEFRDPQLPGELGLLISESNARAFYRRWRDLLLADQLGRSACVDESGAAIVSTAASVDVPIQRADAALVSGSANCSTRVASEDWLAMLADDVRYVAPIPQDLDPYAEPAGTNEPARRTTN